MNCLLQVGQYLQNLRLTALPGWMDGKSRSFRLCALSSQRKSPPFTILRHYGNYDFNQSTGIRVAYSKIPTKMSGAFSHAAETDSDPVRSQLSSFLR